MTDETTPKTAEEHKTIEDILDKYLPDCNCMPPGLDQEACCRCSTLADLETELLAHMRRVAQQVRQQCAEEATANYEVEQGGYVTTYVEKESILSLDIEQFIK